MCVHFICTVIFKNMSQGYVLIALGRQYIDMCVMLGNTLRKNGERRPISVIIHETDVGYAKLHNMFDRVLLFDSSDAMFVDCITNFEKYCLYPRMFLHKYIVYDENIIVDSDVLCQYSPENIWDIMKTRESPICMIGAKYNPVWHWGTIGEVSAAVGKQVPETHGGFFYIRKNVPFVDEFFAYCQNVFYDYDKYNCKRLFRGGKTDEIIFAIAHTHFNMSPVGFDEFPIMTFNYSTDIAIPSMLQTEGERPRIMQDYIPFIHMFDKISGTNFQSLYRRIMESTYLPKQIWLLWLQGWENAPPLQRAVVESWRINNPSWKIMLLSRANLGEFGLGISKDQLNSATPQALSDMIRLALMADHGGVWADATMVCMQPLDPWVHDAVKPAGFWMYHGSGSDMAPIAPASWFLVSYPHSVLATMWRNASDDHWTNLQRVDLGYFWMDMLFKMLHDASPIFRDEWLKVPYIHCEAPGQSHCLANNVCLQDNFIIKDILTNRPPYAVKLWKFINDLRHDDLIRTTAWHALQMSKRGKFIAHHSMLTKPRS